MLFGRAGKSFTGLFATHPPLTERLRALDPGFREGEYIATDPHSGMTGPEPAAPVSGLGGTTADIRLDNAGMINPVAGGTLRDAIPVVVSEGAHSSHSAWLRVLALGLERGGGSATQRRRVENQFGSDRAARCFELNRQVETLPAGLRLPLFELAAPALKARPPEQIRFLFELLQRLADADGHVSLSEYLLGAMLRTHFFPGETIRASAAERLDATRTLIAIFAVEGHDDPAMTRAAFRAGIDSLGESAGSAEVALDGGERDAADYQDLDRALATLAGAPPPDRRRALLALAVTMRHDKRTSLAEAELFRVVAATLGCPIPPTGLIG
jgi:hypothetical protein